MVSAMKELLARHRAEINALRASCKHPKSAIRLYKDRSQVGAGCAYPHYRVVCQNCGTMKIVFREQHGETQRKVLPTLKRQPGFKDQRLGLYAREYDL